MSAENRTDAVPDGYTGHVSVGGPAQTRHLPGLDVTKVAVGPHDNNCYLLRCTTTGRQLLVDAANDPETLLALVGDAGLERIVTTHRHGDHTVALAELARRTGARTAAHELDAEAIPLAPDEILHDGDTVRVGDASLRVIHLQGHTPGGAALVYEADPEHPHLFTGDCLFPGGVGNTFGDAANFAQLIDDVEKKLFGALPDTTWVYPGHGDDTTLGAERPALPEWHARGW